MTTHDYSNWHGSTLCPANNNCTQPSIYTFQCTVGVSWLDKLLTYPNVFILGTLIAKSSVCSPSTKTAPHTSCHHTTPAHIPVDFTNTLASYLQYGRPDYVLTRLYTNMVTKRAVTRELATITKHVHIHTCTRAHPLPT